MRTHHHHGAAVNTPSAESAESAYGSGQDTVKPRGPCRRSAIHCFALLLAFSAGRAAAEDGVTVAALNIAYTRECDSRLQYEAFASRAERDGLPVAALAFRAAAAGESVHAARHALELGRLGAEPLRHAHRVVVRSTAENLGQAIADEIHENQFIYRQLVDQSRAECQYASLTALDHARRAEATHASMFAEVLQDLEAIETPGILANAQALVVYSICMGDGSVFTHELCGSCPNCGAAGNYRTMACARRPQRGGRQLSMQVPR